MTILLSADDIKRIVSEPTKLPPSSSADDYQMERYQRVVIEQAAVILADDERGCPPKTFGCSRDTRGIVDCRSCWRAYLEREAHGTD
jgi:hypothetical protein